METLRAFIWLRWRLVANAFRGGQRRDRFEQVSRAITLIMPLLLVVLSLGTIVGVTVIGYLGGRALSAGLVEPEAVLLVMRVALLFVTAIILFFAFWLPIQSSLSRYNRLLLLPIRRRTLHGVEFASAMADPWIAFIAPGLMTFAVGLALGGLGWTALVAAVAGGVLLLTFAGMASLIGFLVSWLFRSRRRAEMFTLVFVMSLTLVSLVPAMVSSRFEGRQRDAEASGSFDELRRSREQRSEELRLWLGWTRGLPSQLYVQSVEDAMVGNAPGLSLSLSFLGAQAFFFFFASSVVHDRLIGSVEGRGKRRVAVGPVAIWRLPLAASATSAVAWAQVKTALRSVRGRLSVILPGPLVASLVVIFRQLPDENRVTPFLEAHGHLLLAVGLVFSLYSFQAIAMNLFGTDKAGLSMQFLQPISTRELARGKIAGIGLVMGVTSLLCLVCALVVVPVGSPSLWVATALGGAATFFWLGPVFIWLSALFPVAADLSKTGSGGNPHGLTMLIGTLLVPLIAAPAAVILLIAEFWLQQPIVAVPLMAGWLAIAIGAGIPLLTVASRMIDVRRENLAIVAQGR